MNGRIELNLAMSLDGFIVDENGKYDWIVGDGDHSLDTDDLEEVIEDFGKEYDVVVMGKTSFLEFGEQDMFKGKEIVVATHEQLQNTKEVTYVSEELVEYVCSLRDSGKNVWLFGGSILTDYFIKANEIDFYKVAIVPIIIGNGKKLFFDNNPQINLHLDTFTSKEGMMILNYSRRNMKIIV